MDRVSFAKRERGKLAEKILELKGIEEARRIIFYRKRACHPQHAIATVLHGKFSSSTRRDRYLCHLKKKKVQSRRCDVRGDFSWLDEPAAARRFSPPRGFASSASLSVVHRPFDEYRQRRPYEHRIPATYSRRYSRSSCIRVAQKLLSQSRYLRRESGRAARKGRRKEEESVGGKERQAHRREKGTGRVDGLYRRRTGTRFVFRTCLSACKQMHSRPACRAVPIFLRSFTLDVRLAKCSPSFDRLLPRLGFTDSWEGSSTTSDAR